jgi:hypothetical protein
MLRKTRLTPERVSDPKVHKRVLRTATSRAPVDQETDKAPAPAELRIRDFSTPNEVRRSARWFRQVQRSSLMQQRNNRTVLSKIREAICPFERNN